MSFQIPTADDLVTFVKSFTGSTNDTEIKQCIYLAELSMRNIELPALRTNPWTTIGIADQYGAIPIPADTSSGGGFGNWGGVSSSGGGGGGGGFTGASAASGGRGGDGIVIATAW